jgi:hypothetical protein
MFGKLVRTLLGSEAAAPRPESRPRVQLSDILSIPSVPLRAYFEDRYHRRVPEDREIANRHAQAAIAAALGEEPLPIATELHMRAPAMYLLNLSENSGQSRQLKYAFDEALEAARTAVVQQHGRDLPVPDDRLCRCLNAAGLLVSLGQLQHNWGYGLWLDPLVNTAAQRQSPAVRQALVKMFNDFFGGDKRNYDQARELAEKLLPISGLARSAIAGLAETDSATAKLDSIRERVLADASPELRPALTGIFDGEATIGNYSLRESEKSPVLRALCDLDPAGRGRILHDMLNLLDRRDSYGIGRWGRLIKSGGKYRFGIQHEEVPRGFGNILGAMASRKIELVDPDGDAARFIGQLRYFWNLENKRILAMLLDVARANPHGKMVAALRAIVDAGRIHGSNKWLAEIEDMLRDLPVAPAPASPAQRVSVPVTGFGRKGASAASAASTLRGLEPIALPQVQVNNWQAPSTIGRHFDNLFDARLYDAPHRNFLARLTALAEEIDALPGDDRSARNRGMVEVAKRLGFSLMPDHDVARAAFKIEHVAAIGRDLDTRAGLFEPFVTGHPEEARVIGKLAADIASKSAPLAKWLAEARKAFGAFPEAGRQALIEAALASPTPFPDSGIGDQYLRTLIYLAADLEPSQIGPALADYALKKCFVTQKNFGIRAEKLGNACLWALAAMPEGAGVPYLARILARTKYPKIRAKIDEKLNQAAEAAGISRAALDELTVPTHDLDRHGTRRFAIGGGEAVMRVLGGRDVAIEWLSDSGKPLKAPSAAMKEDKAGLKEIKEAAKEIEADLGTQLVRLQRLYLEDRSWPAAEWRERYIDHPLVQTMARRLIWSVDRADRSTVSALSDEQLEQLLDVAGKPVALDDATIRLWHPIDAEVAEVEAWRERLEQLQITQPFAQAWREIYALTDAERTTGTYSNRWAAHILKQHQAMTLARLNGWRVTHRMWVDAPNDEPWHLSIPAHGVVVDYWVEGAGGEDPEVSESGAYAYVSTDRVQFHVIDSGGPDSARGPERGPAVPLAELPPIVFSEVMRQADLFTAVASIAADPNWLDRGGEAAHPSQWGHAAAVYWTRANTAELAESGKRRRAMLDRIVPRLKIADRVSLDDRYLHVQGKRHRYKVHLGSGACFRGERHLCIVPKAADAGQRLWLPFEGDRTLSIILSKALLLADDDKITDPVILRQL